MLKEKDVSRLLSWYREKKRDLPWRHTPDAYKIWVSEIMLQQTRVEAVKPYYAAFLKKSPDVTKLANAKEEELIRIWEGLGYYSRVRNMHKAAVEVTLNHGGFFPVSYEVLLTLPGIGEYTAGAVASIAGGENVPAVDGNVLRVYTRVCANEGEISNSKVVKEIREELRSVMKAAGKKESGEKTAGKKTAGKKSAGKSATEKKDAAKKAVFEEIYSPGDFNSAMMELGATVCLPNGEPKCESCPFSKICLAKKQGNMTEYPKKAPAKKRKIEERTVFILESTKGIALKKRPEKGLLAGMYEFPAKSGYLSRKEAVEFVKSLGYHPLSVKRIEDAKHIFSHMEWHMQAYYVSVDAILDPEKEDPENGIIFVTKKERMEGFALPSAFETYKKYIFR